MEKKMEKEKQELMLIGELMVDLVVKGITVADVASILYEVFVRKLEDDDDKFTRKELEEIIDNISDFQMKHNLW